MPDDGPPSGPGGSHEGERLQKVLARAGLGSRRVCEDLISDGRVTVNGELPVLGRRVDVETDLIELDGVPVPVRPGLVHYLVNKPPGVVSTAEDTHGRPTVVGLVPAEPRAFPVGRLDMDSEGLIIVTNDGELTHRLTHPSYGVPKEYLVQVSGTSSPAAVRALREGVDLEAYAQKDPKLIYKKEGHELFRQMIERIKWQVVETLFHVEVKSAAELEELKREAERRRAAAKRQMQEVHASESLHEEAAQVEKMARQMALQQAQLARQAAQSQRTGAPPPALAPELLEAAIAEHAHATAGAAPSAEPVKVETFRRERPKIGRNDPCWCGSGNKYKKCHMQSDEEAGAVPVG